jgi:hypothetical protein
MPAAEAAATRFKKSEVEATMVFSNPTRAKSGE